MAGGDYYSCDSCFKKTYYDSDIEYDGVGIMKVLCKNCSETKTIIIIDKESLDQLWIIIDFKENEDD